MSRFVGGFLAFMKMIFFAFIIVICVETPVEARRLNSEVDDLLVDWAGYGEEKLSTVVISGKLLCHTGANIHPSPVSGASMAVFCGTNGRRTKKLWAKGRTDSFGEFIIDLPSRLHAIPDLEKMCQVKVLHLPRNYPCRRAFTGKHNRIELRSRREGVRTYTTNNLHLMPKPSDDSTST
ncbi:hypothetical protein F511_37802 [Dorcoceras hygrometricum]|uniref:Pollen Ole e 1 allergen and extensin family protein n=1 Tax=Dorcoceras hygrometricum TaxID=472368 RepID=A0A2Z7DBZ4_9LAMI|nr:hypothetical protein F511_37802 [Dorcoceras hygrometricum]